MKSLYEPFLEKIRAARSQGVPTVAERQKLEKILSPVLKFLERLSEEGYVSEVRQGVLERSVTCVCRMSNGKWIVARCSLPIDDDQAEIQLGVAGSEHGTMEKTLRKHRYPVPDSEEDGINRSYKLLDLITELITGSETG
jgi:hypothetical protein